VWYAQTAARFGSTIRTDNSPEVLDLLVRFHTDNNTNLSDELHNSKAHNTRGNAYLGCASDNAESNRGADRQQVRQKFQLTKFDHMNCILAVQSKAIVFGNSGVWHYSGNWHFHNWTSRYLCKQK